MIALVSAWLGLAGLVLACTMLIYRPAFTDVLLVVELYFVCPAALTLAGIALWVTRHHKEQLAAARTQAKVAIVTSVVAVIIVYAIMHHAQRLPAGS